MLVDHWGLFSDVAVHIPKHHRKFSIHYSQVPAYYFECSCPDAVAIERLAKRTAQGGAISEARVDHYERHSALYEPSNTVAQVARVDTESPLAEQLEFVYRKLRVST